MSHLVQRLTEARQQNYVNPFGGAPGASYRLMAAGAGVELDYMGAAEYEWGTAEESLARMLRAAKQLRVVTRRLVRPTYEEPAYLIVAGNDRTAKQTVARWEEWTQRPYTMEPTGYFRDLPRDEVNSSRDVVGWWDFRDDVMWARDPDVAARMLGALARLGAEREAAE